MSLGPWEIALIFLVVLLVFGAKRIPEIARGMGKGIREFKDATNDIKREISISDTPAPPPAAPPQIPPAQAVPPAYTPPVQQAHAAPPPPGAPPAAPPTEGQPTQS